MVKESLKIAIIAKSTNFPEWVHDVISQINNSDFMELKLILIKQENTMNTSVSAVKTTWLYRMLMKLYLLAESKIIPVANNSVKLSEYKNAMQDVKIINFENSLTLNQIEEISWQNPDVLLNVDLNSVPANIISLFQLGIIYNKISYPDTCTDLPMDWFVMNNYPCIEAKLIFRDRKLVSQKKLVQTYFSPDSFFINRVKSQYFWKASLITMRGLNELYNIKNNICNRDYEKDKVRKRKNYDSFYLNSIIIYKHLLKYIRKAIDNKLNVRQWIILYKKSSSRPGAIDEYQKIVPPKKNFWADPHVIERNGSHFIFIEEFTYKTNKGHLSVLEIDSNGKVNKPVKILEKPYHLSYPFIFEHEGNMYMIPETEQNETIDVYKCAEFPAKWEFYKHLFEGISAVDSTMAHYNGKWWIFLNKKNGNYMSYKDELYLYYADSPLSDKWTAHPLNPVVSDVRSARSAGRIYKHNGFLIRPSQDCSVEYGYRIKLNKIIELNETNYREVEFDMIQPNYDKNICGMHTLAQSDEFTVLDCKIKTSKMPGIFSQSLLSRTNIY